MTLSSCIVCAFCDFGLYVPYFFLYVYNSLFKIFHIDCSVANKFRNCLSLTLRIFILRNVTYGRAGEFVERDFLSEKVKFLVPSRVGSEGVIYKAISTRPCATLSSDSVPPAALTVCQVRHEALRKY